MRRALSAILVVAVALVGVLVLRRLTMSTDTSAAPGTRMEIVFAAEKIREPAYGLTEMAQTHAGACRFAVTADVVRFESLDTHRFRMVISPDLNASDRQELRGCLEDLRVDHFRADVLTMTTLETSG